MENIYDLAILGAGPAGICAAIYATRAKLNIIWLDKKFVQGGQIVDTYEVDNYPGLPGDKYYERAKKYMPSGTCGVISFGVAGGRKAAEEFMKHLKLAIIATHVADAHTCVLHPASSTHRQLTDEELVAGGVAPDMVRLSVGIENADDIIADLSQALDQVT